MRLRNLLFQARSCGRPGKGDCCFCSKCSAAMLVGQRTAGEHFPGWSADENRGTRNSPLRFVSFLFSTALELVLLFFRSLAVPAFRAFRPRSDARPTFPRTAFIRRARNGSGGRRAGAGPGAVGLQPGLSGVRVCSCRLAACAEI